MSHEILLADDSKTIQKVISITLGSTPYNLHIATSESEAEEVLKSKEIGLVLLDFGLSENKSGYQLAAQLQEANKNTSIVMLFGTFDTVDEAELNAVGVKDKIVKPFDSQHFLKLCENVLGDSSDDDYAEAVVDLDTDDLEEEDNDWVVQSPTPPTTDEIAPPDLGPDSLTEQVKEWGIEVPPVIGTAPIENDFSMTENIPPIIDEEDTKEITQSFKMTPEVQSELNTEVEIDIPDIIPEEINDPALVDPQEAFEIENLDEDSGLLPEDKDLEYPDITPTQSRPQLIPIEELNHPDEPEASLNDFTDPTVNISEYELNKAQSIEDQISDEQDPDDFWALDDEPVFEQDDNEYEEVHPQFESQESDFSESNSSDHRHENQGTASGNLNYDEILKKLEPMIEQKIKEYCEQTIEKVAWEVIPDLAENLIKKQLESIKQSVVEE